MDKEELYLYFWIPITSDSINGFQPYELRKERVLSDLEKRERLHLRLYINDKKDLSIEVVSEGGYRRSIECTFFSNEKNGLFIYKVNDSLENIDKDLLKTQVYHLFKSFFHEHIFHSPNDDRILGCAFTSKDPNSSIKAIEHYLNIYQEKFQVIDKLLQKINIHTLLKDFKKNLDIEEFLKKTDLLKSRIKNTYGEMVFASYLAKDFSRKTDDSKYIDFLLKEKEFLSMVEKDIEYNFQKVSIAYSDMSSKKQNYLAIFLTVVGIIVSLKT